MFKEPTGLLPQEITIENKEEEKKEFSQELNRILESENQENIRTEIQKLIQKALDDFKVTEKTEMDFAFLWQKIDFMNMSLPENEYDRSWTQEQMDEVIQYIFVHKTDNDRKPKYFAFGPFTTSRKEKRETNTISDLTAKSIISFVKKGGIINTGISRELRLWLQGLNMVDSEIRLDFTSILMNNPGQTDEGFMNEVIRSHASFGDAMILPLKEMYEKNKDNLSKKFKLVEFFFFLKRMQYYESWLEEAGETSGEFLDKIESENKNYFLGLKLKKIKNPSSKKILAEKKYDDLSAKKEQIKPMGLRKWNETDFLDHCVYSQISDKYGVIYNPLGSVDSFFELNSDNPISLRLEDIIEKEDFDWQKLSSEDQERIQNN